MWHNRDPALALCSTLDCGSSHRLIARWLPGADHKMAARLLSIIVRYVQESKWTLLPCFHLKRERKPFLEALQHTFPTSGPCGPHQSNHFQTTIGIWCRLCHFLRGWSLIRIGILSLDKREKSRFILISKWKLFKNSAYQGMCLKFQR